jgi:hypothetical protein
MKSELIKNMKPEELLKRAGESNGAAFVLLSVAKMYANQTEDDLKKLAMGYRMQEKYAILKSVQTAGNLKKQLGVLENTLFKARAEDDIFDDVNDFYMVFKTITEKVGDSEERMKKMLEIIKGAEL